MQQNRIESANVMPGVTKRGSGSSIIFFLLFVLFVSWWAKLSIQPANGATKNLSVWNVADLKVDGIGIDEELGPVFKRLGEPTSRQLQSNGFEELAWPKINLHIHVLGRAKTRSKITSIEGTAFSTKQSDKLFKGEKGENALTLMQDHCVMTPNIRYFAGDSLPTPFKKDSLSDGDYVLTSSIRTKGVLTVVVYKGIIQRFRLVKN